MDGQRVLSLRPYLDVLYRHRISAACTLAVGLGITFCSLLILPNIYLSSTVVLIQPQTVAPVYVSAPAATDTLNRVKILTEEALSRTRLERIIRQMDLYPRERSAGEPMDVIVDRMRRHVFVDLKDEQQASSRLNSFRIAFEYPQPAVAQKVTAHLADIYVDEDLRQRSSQTEAASEFLRDQAANAQAKLEEKENQIKAYKTRHRGALPEQLEDNLRELERLQEQLGSVNDALTTVKEASPETELTQLETKLTKMRAQYSNSHPDVVALQAQVEALKKSRHEASRGHESLGHEAGQSDGVPGEDMQSLGSRRTELRQAIEECRERIAQTPMREQELDVLNRDHEVLTKDYEQLLHKQLEAQVSARLEQRQEGERLRVLDPASLPLRPERPNRVAIAVLGVTFSLLAALGLPFALYFTDTSFKDPEELAREYGVPVLVAIPLVDEVNGRSELRWAAVRAVGASCLTLSTILAALWIYATRFF